MSLNWRSGRQRSQREVCCLFAESSIILRCVFRQASLLFRRSSGKWLALPLPLLDLAYLLSGCLGRTWMGTLGIRAIRSVKWSDSGGSVDGCRCGNMRRRQWSGGDPLAPMGFFCMIVLTMTGAWQHRPSNRYGRGGCLGILDLAQALLLPLRPSLGAFGRGGLNLWRRLLRRVWAAGRHALVVLSFTERSRTRFRSGGVRRRIGRALARNG